MRLVLSLAFAAALVACGDDAVSSGGGGSGQGGAPASGGDAQQGGGSEGGANNGGSAQGGAGGGEAELTLEALLERLRADFDGTMIEESFAHGFPVRVVEGRVVVSDDPTFPMIAGDFDGWTPEPLTQDEGFYYAVVPNEPNQHYKLTDGTTYVADPWSRSYVYDEFGEMSVIDLEPPRFDRFRMVGLGTSSLDPRTVRVLVPAGDASHVLYAHDGQNLFDPEAIWGGWHLQDSAPPAMMIVGVDNTPARMDEYTQVADDIGSGPVGGEGDAYADLVEHVVRPLIAEHYGEPAVVGTLGSSLGGLISLHIGLTYPGSYDFVGSMSGTLGWGSIGASTGETMIERYQAAPLQPFTVYLDSGGDGPCVDSDSDGIDDDSGTDNYCETGQMLGVLEGKGWTEGDTLFYVHDPGAPHNEQAWAGRVDVPLGIFAAM